MFHSDHSFFCEDCSLHFYINAAAAVAAIIENEAGDVLFTRRSKDPARGSLDLPGGFVDVFETVEEALRREIKEELSLEIVSSSYLCSFPNRYLFGGLVYFTLDLVFRCTVKDFSTMSLNDEISESIFMPITEVDLESIGLESIKNIVAWYSGAKVKTES